MARKIKSDYTADDIDSLNDIEHVRLRTQIYLGSMKPTTFTVPQFSQNSFDYIETTFIPSVMKAVGEILDNCIDEFENAKTRAPVLTIKADPTNGHYVISDNGRGVPITKHSKGIPTPEVVFGELRSGRNFKDGKEAGVIGQNGVGSACVNFCSEFFKITIVRDGKKYSQTYKDGATKKTAARTTKTNTTKTGTTIEFKLDPAVFKDVSLPGALIKSKAMELALTNPGLTVNYSTMDGSDKQKFKFKSFEDVIKKISNTYYKFPIEGRGDVFVLTDVVENTEESMFTWVNSSLLYDGGLCNTQFANAFTAQAIEGLTSRAKRQKCSLVKSDVRQNLLILATFKLSDPEYDSQSKTRITGPCFRNEFKVTLEEHWPAFARKNKDWVEQVIHTAMVRHGKAAIKEAEKEQEERRKITTKGFLEATSKNREQCRLLITEGQSAASKFGDVRNPKTDAVYPLTGKMNNVYGKTVSDVNKMGKLTDLLAVIGLVPGKKVDRQNLRYGKIIIATDADTDGDDIFTILANLFFQFWPELFDGGQSPIIHRLLAPNVVVSKGNKRIHFPTKAEFKSQSDKYSTGWTVEYMKGLGSMVSQDWKMLLENPDAEIPFVDDGRLAETFELLFGPSTDDRKEWLS